MDSIFDTSKVISIAFQWRRTLAIVTLAAAVVGVAVSSKYIIHPRYKSTAIIYPANLDRYSDESQTEQLLQWLNSQDVKDSVIKKTNLGEHYHIDPVGSFYRSKVQKTFDQFTNISKTQYQSISISVEDVDAKLACELVNLILLYTDKKIGAIKLLKINEIRQSGDKLLSAKQREIDSINRLLANKGSGNYPSAKQEYTRMQMPSNSGGEIIKTQRIRTMGNDNTQTSSLLNRRVSLEDEYSLIQQQVEQNIYSISRVSTFINIVTNPQVAERKCYPNRMLVVLSFAVGTFLLSLAVILFSESKKAKA